MNNYVGIIICFIVSTTGFLLYFINKSINSFLFITKDYSEYSWVRDISTNILGYSTLFLPGYLVYKYVRKTDYLNKNGNSGLLRLLYIFFGEDELISPTSLNSNSIPLQRTTAEKTLLLLFYFIGLQVSYLTWGILQEKVMTTEYVDLNGNIEHFKDSQFLVFVNRVLAFTISGAILLCKRQPRNKCPLYKYVYCSFSNIMSSWCQYEALKYVSFPHQVLSKAGKVIPVMIMGKFVSKTKYEFYEYVTAVILSVGMLFFMLDTGNDRAKSTVTTISGAVLLCAYILFDSFTSNWQGELFRKYTMKPIQMMCFVNFFSCILTAVSLLQQDSFSISGGFMLKHQAFVVDCILLSICSASGQLFIFSTLSVFGPLVFAIITTVRQGFSVLLSCVIYHHRVSAMGIFGLFLVFFSILLRIYCGHRLKVIKKNQSDSLKGQRI